jgi:ribosome-associated protein
MLSEKQIEILNKELSFKAVRSSGAGGQHVNKVSSKVELFFDLQYSKALSNDEKQLLFKNLQSRLSKEQVLILSCAESRSQHKNKEIVINRFLELLNLHLVVPKVRRATKPSRASVKKRLDNKKKIGEKKSLRKKPKL